MMNQNRNTGLDVAIVNAAVSAFYHRPRPANDKISESQLLRTLAVLQSEGESSESIISQVEQAHPNAHLGDPHLGLLSLITEGFEEVVENFAMPNEIAGLLRPMIPAMCRIAISEGIVLLCREHGVLTISDYLMSYCAGLEDFSSRLGIAAKDRVRLLMDSLAFVMDANVEAPARARRNVLALLAEDLKGHVEAQVLTASPVEQRLADAEVTRLVAERATNVVSVMMNDAVGDQPLPESASDFLRGDWSDALERLLARKGFDSDEWIRATISTEKLIWSVQVRSFTESDEEGQDYVDTVETLPNEIEQLLLSVDFDEAHIREDISRIIGIHVAIMSGATVNNILWTRLPVDESLQSPAVVSQELLDQVGTLTIGQCFILDAQGSRARCIKLVRKLPDFHLLLFTDRAGQKVIRLSFDEFAYFLASEAVRSLPGTDAVGRNLRKRVFQLVSTQQRVDREAEARAREQEAAERLMYFEPEKLRDAVRAAHADSATVDQTREITGRLSELGLGGWLRLIHPDQGAMEGKVAVKFPTQDRVILVDRTGLNLGEFSHELLSELMLLGHCELLASAATDDLRAVVTRMRDLKQLEGEVGT